MQIRENGVYIEAIKLAAGSVQYKDISVKDTFIDAVFQLYQIRRTDKSCCHLFPACIPYTMTYYYSTPNKYQFQILSEKNYTIKTYFFSRLKGVNIVTILLLQSLIKQILCKYCCIKRWWR